MPGNGNIFNLRTDPATTLAHWLVDEKAALARAKSSVEPRKSRTTHLTNRSGYAVMQALIRGSVPCAAVGDAMGFCIVEIAPGHATIQATPDARFPLHEGWITTVLDSAMTTLQSSLAPSFYCITTDLSVRFRRRLTPTVGRVRASVHVTGDTGHLVRVEGKLFGPDGIVYADARGAFVVQTAAGLARARDETLAVTLDFASTPA